jgi:hypothetical protein
MAGNADAELLATLVVDEEKRRAVAFPIGARDRPVFSVALSH